MKRAFKLIFLVGLLFMACPAYCGEYYEFVSKWGSYGSGDGEFIPMGVATDGEGNVYVADVVNHRIQKFDSNGSFTSMWGKEGSGNGDFLLPSGIATDKEGNIYVVDSGNHRIQKFTKDGVFITKWGLGGTESGQFIWPIGIATDDEGNVYVADGNMYFIDVDEGNNRIQKFTKNGVFITMWGKKGSGNGEFNAPSGIATDNEGNIYVVDTGNQRIQKFTKDGAFITKWGKSGTESGQFICPMGIATDDEGNVYVADGNLYFIDVDKINHHIQKFTTDGTFTTKWGRKGSGDGEFIWPSGITIDNKGNIYVVDIGNHRIQKFRMIIIPMSSPTKEIPVYPNPFKAYSLYNHNKITFGDRRDTDKMLPEEGIIKIYNVAGELIKTMGVNLADGGRKEWDVKNEEGEPLAAGVYIYIITNLAGEKTAGRIGIVK